MKTTFSPFALRCSVRTLAAVALLALAGCASGPGANPRDPLEPFNRGVTKFNDGVDEAVLKPVATAYKNVLPYPIRKGVNNFFGNLNDLWSFVNNVLQGKAQNAAETWTRLNINTFLGLGGFLDIATDLGLDRHYEDFGQTLGRWGVPAGPYLVLPLLGPSTIRDALAIPVDRVGDPVSYVDPTSSRYAFNGVRIIDLRANLLRVSSVLDNAALDKYTFTRDAYLQKRRAEVFDSAPRNPDNAPSDGSLPPEAPAAGAPEVAAPVTPGQPTVPVAR